MMEYPLITYNSELRKTSFNSIKSESNKIFLEKYLQNKKQTINDIKINCSFLFPGRLFTYNYLPINRDNINKLPFYDLQPLSIILSYRELPKDNSMLITAINLHFIPHKHRIVLLNEFYKNFRNLVEKECKFIGRGNVDTLTNEFFNNSFDFGKIFSQILQKVFGNKYNMAIRSYRFEMVSNIKIIEYNDWFRTAFVDSNEYVRIGISDIIKNWNNKK